MDDHILDLIRSHEQRFRVWFVKWDSYQIRQSVPLLADASTDPPTLKYLGTKTASDFLPIINIGSNRLAFVDESIDFDCSRSFRIHGGTISGTPHWEFETPGTDGTHDGSSFSLSWNTPGLYRISCTWDGGYGERYVRVLQDRTSNTYDVVNISSLSGSVSGGWKASIVIAQNDDEPGEGSEVVSIGDFQSVGIFCEEEFHTGSGSYTTTATGPYDDPRLLIAGYIQNGTVVLDANTHTLSFDLVSISDAMNNANIYGTQTWNKKYIDADHSGPNELPNPPQGVILNLDLMTIADTIIWWMQTYTNILSRHDFLTWYDDSLQEIDTVSTSEGSIWSAFAALADNEFAWWFVDPGGGIHFEPNPMIRSQGWFEDTYPNKMEVIDVDLLNLQNQVKKMRQVIWVQLIGTRVRDGKQWTVRYPTEVPRSGVGEWKSVTGLSVSRQSFLQGIIANVFKDANRRITATLTFPLYRVFSCPDRLTITITDPDRNITWDKKEFYVNQITYNINPQIINWQTTLNIVEVIPTHTKEFTASGVVV